MKKFTLIVITAMIMLVLAGCGKSDSPDAVIEDMLNAFDSYIADMDKSEDVDGAIAAMEKFAKVMEALKPRMEEVEKKYPNLKNTFKGDEIPDEFKKFEGRIKEMGPKMGALMGKMMKYMGDPKFQEAAKKFQESMQ
ncbi:MAG: hypothetical protein ABFR36_03860 [Acidobacteriota bacterium]